MACTLVAGLNMSTILWKNVSNTVFHADNKLISIPCTDEGTVANISVRVGGQA